jgi:hypothetical protein
VAASVVVGVAPAVVFGNLVTVRTRRMLAALDRFLPTPPHNGADEI